MADFDVPADEPDAQHWQDVFSDVRGYGAELVTEEDGDVFRLHPGDLQYTYQRLTWTLEPTRDIELVAVEVRPAGLGYDAAVDLEVRLIQTFNARGLEPRSFEVHRAARVEDFIKDFGAVFTPPVDRGPYQLTFVLKPAAKEMFIVWLDSLMERGLVSP